MNDSISITQPTEFRLTELSLEIGNETFDIGGMYEELNLFDSIFLPCVSGNIILRDSVNLAEKLKLNGDEKIIVRIDKGEDSPEYFQYRRVFSIYSKTDLKISNMNSSIYKLNLVNEDFFYSLQKKIDQSYTGLYSEFVSKMLSEYLRVTESRGDKIESGIGTIAQTSRLQEVIIPKLNVFDSLNFVAKRSVNTNGNPDFLFFENRLGYNFVSLSDLLKQQGITVKCSPKNIDGQNSNDYLSARNFEVLSTFNTIDNIRNGAYAGVFIGFDTLTRTQKTIRIKDSFSQTNSHANPKSNLLYHKNKENKDNFQMTNSRVVSYPFAFTRSELQEIKEKNPSMTTFIDNTHEYVYQRKSLFTNLMQKRLKLTLSGNFGLFCGTTLDVNVPRFATKTENDTDEDSLDKSLSGKYIIVAARHMLRAGVHETIIEVASDSNLI